MKSKTKQKLKKQSLEITKELLMMLLKFPAGLTEVFFMSDPHYRRLAYDRKPERIKARRALADLRKQSLIYKRESQGRTKYTLTKLGRARALKSQYKVRPKKVRSDGMATIIIFDIPEEKKNARNFFRKFLKANDFTQLQKSVFIGRHYLLPEFNEIVKELNLELHVSILEGRIIRQ